MFTKSILVFVISVIPLWFGCSFIGLGIGARADASKPYHSPFDQRYLAQLRQGMETQLVLTDGREIRGRYAGLDTSVAGQKMRLFDASDTTSVPLDEISRISVKRSGRLRGFVLGATLDFISFLLLQEIWEAGQRYN